MQLNLQDHQDAYEKVYRQALQDRVLKRIWSHDHTVWRPEPAEISNRLGWMDIAERLSDETRALRAFAAQAYADGFTDVLLLGMGGSSLAPEVFRRTFGVQEGGLDLAILDSTDPGAILAQTDRLNPAKTLFIVATKSGGTVETLSFFKHFYNWASAAAGGRAGAQFIAITDPGSRLETLAAEYDFRKVFLNDPNIGGRYSALSYFGLVPAALLGVDLERLLRSALDAAGRSRAGGDAALRLGAALGALAEAGRDKLTFLMSPQIASFGDWLEQLVAESTGKEGRGILPIAGERPGEPEDYGQDRVFVELALPGGAPVRSLTARLEAAGHPVIRLPLEDRYALGGQFFFWELATVIAGHVLGIQPFDQPNVEAAKILARDMVASYHETGRLPAGETAEFGIESLNVFLADMAPGDYIAVQAYVTPSAAVDEALLALRTALREKTRAAVASSYGPRFLHSTGQLHKGDAGRGRFIQITSGAQTDIPIPDEAGSSESGMSFQVLKLAQALGDYQALAAADPPRRVIHFHVRADAAGPVQALAAGLAG